MNPCVRVAVLLIVLLSMGAARYPLKTRRMLYSDEQIATARENIAKYPAARKVADEIIKSADYWAVWSDDDLVNLITPASVPRAFAVSASGCPICGDRLKETNGDYSWIIDPKIPFKVKCPVDGTVFPTNDYAAYYRSGLKDKVAWDTQYVDDGWGWTDPKTGEKFWFVAYWNHWMWHGKLVPGVLNLARAYMLTGDARYAHKALVCLRRIAEVYPAMDHAKQSRYGTMMSAHGIDYPGKVVNHIWECGLVTSLAEAYDEVWETIDRDAELQKRFGQSGEQVRGYIEADFLENAIDALFAGKIRGNFGMHQSALVHLALARQTGENEKWFDALMNGNSGGASELGLGFALYNLIYRDGVPSETAPGYNFIWVEQISHYGELLSRGGRDVFAIPKTKRLYDAALQQICARSLTPSVGDSSNVWGWITGKDAETFQTAYRHYHDPNVARFLASFGAAGDEGFKSFESLFEPPIPATDTSLPPQKSRLLDGYGMAILNDPKDSVGLSLYYGLRAGHGHFDRLTIDTFFGGHPMTPDLGYPDAMNDFVPGIYTWSKNTISHNTVTVDAKRQPGNAPGVVHLFADSPFARVIDVSGDGTYPQCSQYRRAVIMVDVDPDRSYFVDVFTVAGGKQHDYSLHGPPGGFEMSGGKWSEPAAGTLAGENVALGEIYDDAALGAKGYKGGFGGYGGSGFQHLTQVRTMVPDSGAWVAQYTHAKDPNAHVRLRVLDQPDQVMMDAQARVSPGAHPEIVHYLIARRASGNKPSRFVSVIEPYGAQPFITGASVSREDDAVRITVSHDGDTDVISYQPGGDERVSVERAGKSRFTVGETRVSGEVIAVEPAAQTIRVRLSSEAQFDPKSLVGRVVHFQNKLRRTAHPITAAQIDGANLVLTTGDDLLVGRVRVNTVTPGTVTTQTALPLAAIYRGVHLCDAAMRVFYPVREVGGGKIVPAAPLPQDHPIKPGEDAWLVDVGPGDTLEAPGVFYWSNGDAGR